MLYVNVLMKYEYIIVCKCVNAGERDRWKYQ